MFIIFILFLLSLPWWSPSWCLIYVVDDDIVQLSSVEQGSGGFPARIWCHHRGVPIVRRLVIRLHGIPQAALRRAGGTGASSAVPHPHLAGRQVRVLSGTLYCSCLVLACCPLRISTCVWCHVLSRRLIRRFKPPNSQFSVSGAQKKVVSKRKSFRFFKSISFLGENRLWDFSGM